MKRIRSWLALGVLPVAVGALFYAVCFHSDRMLAEAAQSYLVRGFLDGELDAIHAECWGREGMVAFGVSSGQQQICADTDGDGTPQWEYATEFSRDIDHDGTPDLSLDATGNIILGPGIGIYQTSATGRLVFADDDVLSARGVFDNTTDGTLSATGVAAGVDLECDDTSSRSVFGIMSSVYNRCDNNISGGLTAVGGYVGSFVTKEVSQIRALDYAIISGKASNNIAGVSVAVNGYAQAPTVYGYRFSSSTGGTITSLYGLKVENIYDDYSSALQDTWGVFVGDLTALAEGGGITGEARAVEVAAYNQNIYFAGGDYNTGHLQIGPNHLWVDSSNNLRIQYNADHTADPSATDDGYIMGPEGDLNGDWIRDLADDMTYDATIASWPNIQMRVGNKYVEWNDTSSNYSGVEFAHDGTEASVIPRSDLSLTHMGNASSYWDNIYLGASIWFQTSPLNSGAGITDGYKFYNFSDQAFQFFGDSDADGTWDGVKFHLDADGTVDYAFDAKMTDCDSTSQKVTFDISTHRFGCGTDQTSAGGGITDIEEDGTVKVSSATLINFPAGHDVDGSGNVTNDFSESAPTLDQIGNPAANKTFSMSNKTLVYSYTAPTGGDGAFEVEATGGFTGDLMHVHQHTGNPSAVDLLHLEAADADVVALRIKVPATGTALDIDLDADDTREFALCNDTPAHGEALEWDGTNNCYKPDTDNTGGSACDAWPVGGVFLSVSADSPATLLGCGTWSEIGAGRVLVGYNASDTDFDTTEETGGSKTVASSAQTFAGNALGTHQHNALSAGTPAGTISEISATGTTAVKVGTSASNAAANSHTHAAPTFTGSAMATHQHDALSAGTPSGTNTPGAATSVVQPYIVVRIWKRTG